MGPVRPSVLPGEYQALVLVGWADLEPVSGLLRLVANQSQFNLNYTWWAGGLIQGADPGLMATFAIWFRGQVGKELGSATVLADLERYYATAFELIAIGAAALERGGRG